MMQGVNFGEFQEALTDGFDETELEQMVRIRLNERLGNIVTPGTTKYIAFQLLTWAEKQGAVVDLARAAYLERPRNDKIRRIYENFGMAPAASIQQAGAPVPGAATRAATTPKTTANKMQNPTFARVMTQPPVESDRCYTNARRNAIWVATPDQLRTVLLRRARRAVEVACAREEFETRREAIVEFLFARIARHLTAPAHQLPIPPRAVGRRS